MTTEQKGVLTRIALGASVALALLVVGPGLGLLPAMPEGIEGRLNLWMASSGLVAVWLLFCIFRLANLRFRSEADLDPSKGGGSDDAVILQRQLQNTLEQVMLAFIAYGAWSIAAPADWGIAPLVGALLFGLGRVLFFAGYRAGAAARSAGFTLTIYPTVAIGIFGLYAALVQVLG